MGPRPSAVDAPAGEEGMTECTTDVDAMMGAWQGLSERFTAAGVRPTSTLVGVTRLAFPDLMVEIEATAVG